MKKRIALVTLTLAVAVLCVWYTPKQGTQSQAPETQPKAGPGYFDFINSIQGKVPEGAVLSWINQDKRMMKNGTSALDSLEEVGPFTVGGRTRAILIDRDNPAEMWVGGISGGLWHSLDTGNSWSPVNEHQESLNISHITQNPFNPDIIYYTTGEGAGNSSAAPGIGVFKSVDHGKTFSLLSATTASAFTYAWRIEHSLVDSNTIYIATNAAGLYRSEDGGQSFERVYPTSRQVHDLEVFEDGTVMFSVRGVGIITSQNAEPNTMVVLGGGLPGPNSFGRVEMAYCQQQPGTIYAAYSATNNASLQDIYRTDDTGKTWKTLDINPQNRGGRFPFTWYCLTMQVKPDDPEVLIIGSVNVLATEDGGKNWDIMAQSHADYHAIEVHPSSPELVYIGNDGGVYEYRWDDLDNEFASAYRSLNNGLNITQFYTGTYGPEGIVFMGGTQDNGTYHTQGDLSDFKKAYGGDGSYCHIHQQEPGVAYVSSQNGNLRRIQEYRNSNNPANDKITSVLDDDDDGNIDDGAWFINPFTMNYKDGEQLYFVTRKRVFRSNSGGFLWDPATGFLNAGLSNPQIPFCIGISNQLYPTGYVGGNSGLFFRIKNIHESEPGDEENLGSTVPSALQNNNIGCIEVSPLDNSTLYVGFVDYAAETQIWKVTGATGDSVVWTDISGNLPSSLPVNWIEVDPASPDSVIFAATNNGLYYTVDGGQNWEKELGVPNTTIDMLMVRESDRRLFIYTHGRGIFTAKILPNNKSIPDYDALGLKEVKVVESRAYPNPTSGQVRLLWDGPQSDRDVQVIDMRGSLVMESRIKNGGIINLEQLDQGIYFLTSRGMKTKKILKN